jgi:predicted lipoprotein
MAAGPRLQVEPISTDDSSQSLNVVFDEASGSIAIDYSPYYERIASASEATALADYSAYYERIATAMESIATDVSAIKTLAETTGVKSVSPYDLISAASMYSYYSDNVADLDTLITKIASVPTAKLQTIRDAVENFPRLP